MIDWLEVPDNARLTMQRGTDATAAIGRLGASVWELRERLFANLRSGHPYVAGASAMVLGTFVEHADAIVPALRDAISGRNAPTYGALVAASRLGARAIALLPAVLPLLAVAWSEASAIVDAPPARDFRREAFAYLRTLGVEAAPAVPTLLAWIRTRTYDAGDALQTLETVKPLPADLVAQVRETQQRVDGGDWTRLDRIVRGE
jgi:hypothetical protein